MVAQSANVEAFVVERMVFVFYTQRRGLPIATVARCHGARAGRFSTDSRTQSLSGTTS
jgi:hypothetical protein